MSASWISSQHQLKWFGSWSTITVPCGCNHTGNNASIATNHIVKLSQANSHVLLIRSILLADQSLSTTRILMWMLASHGKITEYLLCHAMTSESIFIQSNGTLWFDELKSILGFPYKMFLTNYGSLYEGNAENLDTEELHSPCAAKTKISLISVRGTEAQSFWWNL